MSNNAPPGSAQPAPPQKFLRYRSVRKTIANVSSQEAEPVPSLPQPAPATQSSITRLPSRYHRKVQPSTGPLHPIPSPQAPSSQANTTGDPSATESAVHCIGSRQKHDQQAQRPSTRKTRSRESESKPSSSQDHSTPDKIRRSQEMAREEARLLLEGEYGRLKMLREQESQRRHDQKVRDKQNELEKQTNSLVHSGARGRTTQVATDEPRKPSSESDKAPKLFRGFRQNRPIEGEMTSKGNLDSTIARSRRFVIGGGTHPSQQEEKKHRRLSSAIEPRHNAHGTFLRRTDDNKIDEKRNSAPTTNPNFDAPVSAVNSGERRVGVQCKASTITLPVTLSTTCKDILNSAALFMSEPIDARTAVLVECFSSLGLERPLRRYERIRDVMNSWDNDNQHRLMVMEAAECAANGLHVGDAPVRQPAGTAVQIYHSQRPGHWEKRWLKLWDSGQIAVSKNENALDCTNVCHLSDFDLYTPTAKQTKKLKPPKKLCFALKSQQKASIFLDGANFVHFFCTKDKEVADRWYQGVHQWRSWYLVHMLGEGRQTRSTDASVRQQGERRPGTGNSKETMPYVLGSFKPLAGFEAMRSSIEAGRQGDAGLLHRPSQEHLPRPLIDQVPGKGSLDIQRGLSVRLNKAQAGPYSRRAGLDSTQSTGSEETEDGPFTGQGLLARSATKRSQGGNRSGRGVSGIEGRPLVELHPTSEFTDGSLLRKIEAIAAQEGNSGPRIDRQKRLEINAPVGEGF